MHSKLTIWKGSQLAFACRVTLEKSVIKELPIYPMMRIMIPKGCIKEIHKLQRRFIWGETGNERSYHAIKWSNVTRPKEQGVLGFRKLDVMNKTYTLKLG